MKAALGESHLLLVDVARRIAESSGIAGAAVPERSSFDSDRWSELDRTGLPSLLADGEDAGSVIDAALVAEQLAAALSPLPFVGTVLARRLLGDATDDRAPLGIGLAAGLDQPGAAIGWDVAGAPHAAVLDGDAAARAPLGPRLDGADLTRSLAELRAAEPVRRLEHGEAVRWLAAALALVSADLLGTMQGALDAAVGHAGQRRQFGRPIGSFQAVSHLCADALVSVESTRSVVWHAAWAADELDPDGALFAARVAKAWSSRAALEVCEAAVQVFGGIGITWECPAHAFLRRALLARRTLGDERLHERAIAAVRFGGPG